MFGDDILAAQKSLLKGKYLKSYNNFMTCQKSYHKRPELVILSNGRHYIDGLNSCRCGYCYHCVKVYLYKASLEVAKVNDFIKKEKLRPTMLTLTIPHKVTDRLRDLKIILDKATRNFLAESKNKLMKKINKDVGSEGYILRNEITYNEQSGWHNHCHIVQLNIDDYSESQKNQLQSEFARQLELAGFLFSRLDKYNIEKKGGLIHFRENSFDVSYLSKFDEDNPVNLAISNPLKYVEFAQSFNGSAKIPLLKFKNGLKSRIAKIFPEENNQKEKELRRIQFPESLINQPPEYIDEWLEKELFCS